MGKVQLISALGGLLFLFAAQAAETKGKPTVQVTVRPSSEQVAAGIIVEASDDVGLDSLDIQCREADSTYHTQLSRAAADRQFKRSFTLAEIFPSVGEWKSAIQIEVTVRNTRGAVASATVLVPPTHSKKGI